MNTQSGGTGAGGGASGGKGKGQSKGKTRSGPGGTGGARRPAKGHAVPLPGQGTAGQGTASMGVPIDRAFTGPLSELEGAFDDVNKVCSRIGLGRGMAASGQVSSFLSRIYDMQSVLTYGVARALARAAKRGVPIKTYVMPPMLQAGQVRCLLLDDARRMAAQGQILTADGRLFLGAKFTFFFKRLMAVYQRRLDKGTPEEKAGAIRAFANLDRIRFRILSAAQKSTTGTKSEKAGLRQTAAEQQDAAAFDSALVTMEKGLRPDPLVLQAALRHAQRLDDQHGFGLLAPDIGQGPLEVAAKAGAKPAARARKQPR